MEFREWLQGEIAARGLDPSKLARASKVPQPTIFRILSGETKDPRIGTVKKLEGAIKAYGSDSPHIKASTASPVNSVVDDFERTYNSANEEGKKFLRGAIDAAQVFVKTKDVVRKKA